VLGMLDRKGEAVVDRRHLEQLARSVPKQVHLFHSIPTFFQILEER